MRPQRWQPTRLPRPWDSPGKNTGVGCHFLLQCMKVKSKSQVARSCPTLSDPMDCSLPGSSVHGIFQARVLEWGAIAFSSLSLYIYNWITLLYNWNTVNQFSSVQLLSHVRLFVTPWIAARQASRIITNSWSSFKLMSIKLVIPSSHLINYTSISKKCEKKNLPACKLKRMQAL